MSLRFEFATAGRIIFGAGTLKEAGPIAAASGRKALVVSGRDSSRAAPLLKVLTIPHATFSVVGEPTLRIIASGLENARAQQCDMVIGFGGGSAIDAAKAIAALSTNPGDIFDYLEVIGRAQPLTNSPLPVIAIPTTAGTGAEVTRNAVLCSPEHKMKVSLRSPLMLPKVAIVDPELTYGLPPALTASTGLDALTQIIEPYVSIRANPMTDAICREGLARTIRSLRRAFDDGHDRAAREDMAFASVCGGLALANAGLGAVHGFAAAIGGMFDAPHGAVCAALLPEVMEANRHASERYDEIISADWVRELRDHLHIPKLRAYGITEKHVPAICEKAAAASSMKANPAVLSRDNLEAILRKAI
ncbi:MAG TPA: iron-containing alcohol dehydrogenase [Candidatus Binatia bacterium]|nr:iron-containing alcohol dehydrogenase [Candidatus Binatia bacterium]